MIRTIVSLAGCLIVSLLIVFISVNMMTGCEDWSQPNCVTPKELLGWD